MLAALWQEEEGQDVAEYAFLLVLIGLAAVAAMNSLAKAISEVFSDTANDLASS